MIKDRFNKTDDENRINPNNKNGIFISLISGFSLLFIFFLYSRNTSPENTIFLSESLYTFAIAVLITFFMCIVFFSIGIKKSFFSKRYYEEDPNKLVYHINQPFKKRNYKVIFLLSSIIYFIFFGFLSNMFIIFNDDQTIFSIVPPIFSGSNNQHSHMNMNMDNHNQSQNQQKQLSKQGEIKDNNSIADSQNYPKYRLIICCNEIGYVPMLIVSFNKNFSFLLIPINFISGILISALVGFNLSLNIYLLKQLKTRLSNLSKCNIASIIGISSGLFIGCPTCAGSLFYSLAGFSTLIAFSSLSFFQVVFAVISILLLIVSIITMAKILQRIYLDACRI